jgi:hypothetical protein
MPGLKRHPALQDLSRDHQRILLHARDMRGALAGDRRAQPLAHAAREFTRFWQKEGILHVQEEEEVLLAAYGQRVPLLEDAAVQRVLVDHAWLHQAVAELLHFLQAGGDHSSLLGDIAQRLHDHVRLEERVLFEGVQQALDEEQLDQLGIQSMAFRVRWRGAGAVGPLGGACEL